MTFLKPSRAERKEAERVERERLEEEAKQRYAERDATLDWIATVDKYPGSVTDYNCFKRKQFEEIDVAEFIPGRARKVVRIEDPAAYPFPRDIDLLASLRNSGECVGFVHYTPLHRIGGGYGESTSYVGGYGVPIRKARGE